MGVTKTKHEAGTGATPKVGQTVTIEYTGFLKGHVQARLQGRKVRCCRSRPSAETDVGH